MNNINYKTTAQPRNLLISLLFKIAKVPSKVTLVLVFFCSFMGSAFGKEFPNVSGDVLFEVRADSILSIDQEAIPENSAIVNIEPEISFNINRNIKRH